MLYAQAFHELGALDRLEAFASHYGADFYGLPRTTSVVKMVQEVRSIAERIEMPGGGSLIPFMTRQRLEWKVESDS